MGWDRHVVRMKELGIASTLIDKVEVEASRPSGKPRNVWEDNIKMDRKATNPK